MFIVLDVMCILSSFLTILPSVFLFILGKLCQGLAAGLITVYVPIYVRQISPVYLNTLLASVYCTVQPFGNFLSYVVGYGYSS